MRSNSKMFFAPILLGAVILAVACGSDNSVEGPIIQSPALAADLNPTIPINAMEDPVTQDEWPEALNGIWLRRGYGEVYELHSSNTKSYAITRNSCLFEGEQSGVPGVAEDDLSRIRVEQRTGADVNVHLPGDVFPIVLTRLDTLPSQCDAVTIGVSGVEYNTADILGLLWDNFNEYYAFFNEREVDWSARYNEYLAQAELADEPTLFGLIAELLTPIDDGHVWIDSPEETFSPGLENGILKELETAYESLEEDVNNSFESFAESVLENWYDVLLSYVDAGSLQTGEQMQWATINQSTGYILINSMIGFSDIDNEDELITAEEVRLASEEIDRALDDLSDTTRLVIDIRLNGGGSDSVALALANRFADQRLLAVQKFARGQGLESGHAEAWYEPVSEPYLYPVTILMGRDTASAAEVFALVMQQLPQVTLVGERTQGVFSDILSKTLPNGWDYGLSNEVYLDANGVSYEVRGLSPDYGVKAFDIADLFFGRDAALDLALEQSPATGTPTPRSINP